MVARSIFRPHMDLFIYNPLKYMKLVTNPTEDHDIVDFNVDGALYTVKAGKSERMPDKAVEYLCRVYGFLIDDGKCLEVEPEKTEATRIAAKASAEAVEDEKIPLEEDLSMIHGLGAKSVEKLLKAGIKTKSAFGKLKFDELKELVGALVASKFVSK